MTQAKALIPEGGTAGPIDEFSPPKNTTTSSLSDIYVGPSHGDKGLRRRSTGEAKLGTTVAEQRPGILNFIFPWGNKMIFSVRSGALCVAIKVRPQ